MVRGASGVAALPEGVRNALTVLWAAIVAVGLTAVTGALLVPRAQLLATAVPGAGAAAPQRFTIHPAAATTVGYAQKEVTITYHGATRSFMEHVPTGTYPAGSLPVVVVLSGCCAPLALEATWVNVDQAPTPVIQVYPYQFEAHWNAGACCGSAAAEHVDDVGFVSAVVEAVDMVNPDARPSQAYLVGYSNGGKLAMRIACNPPKWLRGVAVYGATRTADCPTTHAVSVLEMVGASDAATPITGQRAVQNGYRMPTVTELLDDYLVADGCRPPEQQAVDGDVTESAWTHCHGGRIVAEAVFAHLDHTYPLPQFVHGPSANQLVWDFFSALGG